MRKLTHQLTGLALAGLCYVAKCPIEMCCGIAFGATAPDWLEISCWRDGERHSVIPHRTLTHWLSLWLIGLVMLMAQPGTPLVLLLQGFSLGAILHILLDATTPMGIPVFSFSRRRLSPAYSAIILSLTTAGVIIGHEILLPGIGKML